MVNVLEARRLDSRLEESYLRQRPRLATSFLQYVVENPHDGVKIKKLPSYVESLIKLCSAKKENNCWESECPDGGMCNQLYDRFS